MLPEDYEKSEGCLLGWREEASNGLNGMLAVLFLLRNRQNDRKDFSNLNSWSALIQEHNQFSSMTVLGDGQTIHWPDPRDPVFVRLLQAVDSIYDNTAVDTLTHGALYYADLNSPKYNKGGWFDRNVVGKPEAHPRVTTIGTTTYFL
jgi:hypothetical protein